MALQVAVRLGLSISLVAAVAGLGGCSGGRDEGAGSSANAITNGAPTSNADDQGQMLCVYKTSNLVVQISDNGGPSCRKTTTNAYTGVGKASDSSCECPAGSAAVPGGAVSECIVSVDTDAHTSVVEYHYDDGTCVDSKVNTLTGTLAAVIFKAPCTCE